MKAAVLSGHFETLKSSLQSLQRAPQLNKHLAATLLTTRSLVELACWSLQQQQRARVLQRVWSFDFL
jgi:hypothetical protein